MRIAGRVPSRFPLDKSRTLLEGRGPTPHGDRSTSSNATCGDRSVRSPRIRRGTSTAVLRIIGGLYFWLSHRQNCLGQECSCMTLSFTTPRRFIPAHTTNCYDWRRDFWQDTSLGRSRRTTRRTLPPTAAARIPSRARRQAARLKPETSPGAFPGTGTRPASGTA